ncbi:MAG: DUF4173 domain-containing protein [Anaerolineae bacterium]|nr:DUF4173 domain-containing protein [Anaerolineae bacterium]
MLKRSDRLLLAAIALGLIFDVLFWKKPWGISFALFVMLCLITGFVLAKSEGVQPARASLWLLPPIAFLATMSFVRMEPMTTLLNIGLTLFFMAVLTSTFTGGRWMQYTLIDYILRLGALGISALSKATGITLNVRKTKPQDQAASKWDTLTRVARGLLLAVPILWIFAGLLASADPIFSDNLDRFLDIFKIEDFWEFFWQLFIIGSIAYLTTGIFTHALLNSHDEGINKSIKLAYLGFVEAWTILGSVLVLFSAFVMVQFRYFFGGETNIALTKFTYAQYARRGFAELVIVALFSLALFLGLSMLTQREKPRERKIFSGLGIALFILVGVMLLSAFQRLSLYEAAYGFTRLRTYTHVFMVWLALLLLATVVMELRACLRAFPQAALFAALGFTLTLNVLNVDVFIVQKNIALMEQKNIEVSGRENMLDVAYLASLSEDAVPVLSEMYYEAVAQNQQHRVENLAGSLACLAVRNQDYRFEYPWQAFHLSRYHASRNWASLGQDADFQKYLAHKDKDGAWGWFVTIHGEEHSCWSETWVD